jgi:ribonucleotide monophosphatase NagD (HAD superfamily)
MMQNIHKNLAEELCRMIGKPSPIIMEEVTNSSELEKARAQAARFVRN